jgi:hypothetical protein
MKKSILITLGIPEEFGVLILTLSLILLISPYLSNVDFGVFKIPEFSQKAKSKLKVIGPILFLISVLLFIPIIPEPPPDCNEERQITVTVQYPLDTQKSTAQKLREELSELGFNVPGDRPEQVPAGAAPTQGQAWIKYFYDDDLAAARCLRDVVSQPLIKNAKLLPNPGLREQYKPGDIEIWYPAK